MKDTFRATLSKGRQKWCAIFRHPMIPDDSTRKPGLRVRRGLATDNREEAQSIIDDLNVMLSDRDFWQLGARERAIRQFHRKAVSAFYDGDRLRTVLTDPWEKRNEVLPLPGAKDGYSVVQIVGPFGVGKTTLVRQLIGTDPERERFPSTSKGRTTICDTEIICASGDYSAVVSFLSRDRVHGFIEECVESAASAAAEGLSDSLIARSFLEHAEQRFRLKYILGKPSTSTQVEGDDDTDEEADRENENSHSNHLSVSESERQENGERLTDWIVRCKTEAVSVIDEVEKESGEAVEQLSRENRNAFLELVDEGLHESKEIQKIVDEVMEAVEERFQLIKNETLEKDNSDWPIRCQIATADRVEFLKRVHKFSSNDEKLFGRLLTPLVDGIRVKGPFKPKGWGENEGVPSLVLLDGEGLGHVNDSIPTAVTRRYQLAHAIMLVDTAERAMDAGPKALLRSVVSSGHEQKLAVVFTHFDQMKSDAFADSRDKQDHVLNSLEKAIVAVDETLDGQAGAGRRLRKHLADHVFFVGRINETLNESSKATKGTTKALNALAQFLVGASRPVALSDACPCYDLAYLFPAVHKATDQFQETMNDRLQTHWKRVWALTRRFAKQWDDQYENIQPVALLSRLLNERLALFWATPKDWKPANCTLEVQEDAIRKVTQEFASRIEAYVSRRFREDNLNTWSQAFGRSGIGSGRDRSNDVRIIDEDVARVPNEQRASKLFDDIRKLCREAIIAAGGEVILS